MSVDTTELAASLGTALSDLGQNEALLKAHVEAQVREEIGMAKSVETEDELALKAGHATKKAMKKKTMEDDYEDDDDDMDGKGMEDDEDDDDDDEDDDYDDSDKGADFPFDVNEEEGENEELNEAQLKAVDTLCKVRMSEYDTYCQNEIKKGVAQAEKRMAKAFKALTDEFESRKSVQEVLHKGGIEGQQRFKAIMEQSREKVLGEAKVELQKGIEEGKVPPDDMVRLETFGTIDSLSAEGQKFLKGNN